MTTDKIGPIAFWVLYLLGIYLVAAPILPFLISVLLALGVLLLLFWIVMGRRRH